LSGRGLCDELITRPEESYRLCCVVVCDLETSRIGTPYIYDISNLRVNSLYCYVHLNSTELSHTCLSGSSANVAILLLFSPLTRLISLRKYVVEVVQEE